MPGNVRKSGRGEGEIMSLVGDDRDLTHPSTTWVPYLGLPYLLLVNSLHRVARLGQRPWLWTRIANSPLSDLVLGLRYLLVARSFTATTRH
jgi:hypothetical protein